MKNFSLIKINIGTYRGEVVNYNVKTSDRTGRTYLKLNLKLYAKEGQEVNVQKSYCLDPGKNLHIMRVMKDVGGLKKNGNADFGKLLEYYFWISVSYDDFGQLYVEKLRVVHEDDEYEPEDDIEDDFEEDETDETDV